MKPDLLPFWVNLRNAQQQNGNTQGARETTQIIERLHREQQSRQWKGENQNWGKTTAAGKTDKEAGREKGNNWWKITSLNISWFNVFYFRLFVFIVVNLWFVVYMSLIRERYFIIVTLISFELSHLVWKWWFWKCTCKPVYLCSSLCQVEGDVQFICVLVVHSITSMKCLASLKIEKLFSMCIFLVFFYQVA